jgi:hypothetical protein
MLNPDLSGRGGFEIQTHLHVHGDRVRRFGATTVPNSSGSPRREAVIGGSIDASWILVWEEVGSIVATVQNDSTTILLSNSDPFPENHPSGSARAGTDRAWLVAWQYSRLPLQPIAVVGRLVQDRTPSSVIHSPLSNTRDHAFAPAVDGRDGSYLVAWGQTATASGIPTRAPQIVARPLAWRAGAQAPESSASLPVFAVNGAARATGIAFDGDTWSHWAVAIEVSALPSHVLRLGDRGKVVEALQLGPAFMPAPAAAFADGRGEFGIVMGSPGTAQVQAPLVGARLLTIRSAAVVPYGAGCGGLIASASPPYAGTSPFDVELTLPANLTDQNAFLLLGFVSAAIDLGPIGIEGCRLLVLNPTTLATATIQGTGARASFALPATAIGNLFLQWVYLDPSAPRSLPLSTSNGLEVRVRV